VARAAAHPSALIAVAAAPVVSVIGLGAVGARAARHLIATDSNVEINVTDRTDGVASHIVGQLGSRARAVGDPFQSLPSVALVAGPCPHAEVVAAFLRRGVAVVSVGDDLRDVRELLDLDALARQHDVPLVVGAAMSPGLSGLFARQLSSRLDTVDEIHVALHGTGGPACARQHHHILAGMALTWHDRKWVERPSGSGRELCWFPEPLGAWDCYRAAMADPVVLVRAFPEADRVSARLSANRRDRLTSRLPMLSPPHQEGGIGGLRVEVRGSRSGERVTLVAGVAERAAIVAALVAATMALAALDGELPSGAVVLGSQELDTVTLLERLDDAGLSLREFVGTEERTGW